MSLHAATGALALLLIAAAAIDARTRRIPDALNLVVAALGLAVTYVLNGDMLASLIGMIAGFAALFLINLLYRQQRGRDGIGLGDAKLLGGAGAWLGWTGLPFVVLIASATGLMFVAIQRLRGRALGRMDALAFGPFLCVGIFVVWLVQAYT